MFQILEKFLITCRKEIQKTLLVLSFFSLFGILFPSTVKETGEIALYLLWFLLILPILAKVFSFGVAQKLMMFRKEIGILMGVVAFVHSAQYFVEPNAYMPWQGIFWFQEGLITYLGFGMVATVITIVLTLTSNIWSMKKFGKSWKLLHRTVYIVLIFTLLHVAFIHISRSPNIWYTGIISLIPFFVYFVFKVLEWKKVKLYIFDKLVLATLFLGVSTFFGFQIWGQSYILQKLDSQTPPVVESIFSEKERQGEERVLIKAEQELVTEPVVEEVITNTEDTEILLPETIVEAVAVNLNSVIENCNTLCKTDSRKYCTVENEVVFSAGQITYGTCRSLSKYNRAFNRCQGFCESYGNNKGPNSYCTLSDGGVDRNCDGI